MEKNRNYGIDLLRIVSMYMVVILHILNQGGILENLPVLSVRYEAAWFLEIACYCAVNCYALISGYVGLDSQHKYSSILKLWLQVFFYTTLLTLGIGLLKPELVGREQIIKAMLPVMGNNYWYFTAYFPLFFLMPALDHLVNTMPQKQLKTVLFEIFILWSVLQTLFVRDVFGTGSGYSLLWLTFLYVLGAYIKKYGLFIKLSSGQLAGCYIGMILFSWIVKYAVEYFLVPISDEVQNGNWFVKYTSPTIVVAAVALVLLFSRMEFTKGMRLIRFLSPLSFGVYLIHVQPLVWRHVMKLRFASYADFGAAKLVLAVLATALVVYVGCSLIDMFRYYLFKLGGTK